MPHPLDTEIYIRTIRKFSKLLDLLIEELEERKKERSESKVSDFCSDWEKIRDFKILSKHEFLRSYSYLTEAEYEQTRKKMQMEMEKDLEEKIVEEIGRMPTSHY